ncbi:glycosyltransferase [Demequina globuliformis]|uniref:glycosyltransferase n=1 Tax=Demequina globuliformis TaxID=676202 RepID=UPI000781FE11|nr:glycosyltransferase [Demequina globuliformis]
MATIAIAHDYLVQCGGAERVAATWASQFPDSPIYTLAYAPAATFGTFAGRDVHRAIRGKAMARHLDYLLPALPLVARRLHVGDADLALVSTSGWAHHFDFQVPTLAYVHSPARWLYAVDDFRLGLGHAKRGALRALAPRLRAADKRAMSRMSAVVANSRVSQARIHDAYGITCPVVHPPVSRLPGKAERPASLAYDDFSIVVSRNRGYKNVDLAVAASVAAHLPCVVVGTGSEIHTDPDRQVIGLGRVADAELKWLYRHAAVVVASAHEDFGLTVLEANLEGTPAATIDYGGYRETVVDGRNGARAASDTAASLAQAITAARSTDRAEAAAWAEQFSADHHFSALVDIARSAL